ncbi:tetratricopeptide repeat protein [Neochlamydia sp. AcF65]|uniref:tetratricopeptide repeat protein n=1 Tax=Neochlamydia sp. AcF65 TaxID=2795735 RepID=UPI001BCA1A26|nr:tetratricopeptide repeat protein [Neochlamydia sp. AcF65]
MSSKISLEYPYIFPTFEQIEDRGLNHKRTRSTYAEIALKIFKELELLDLCQAKLVCKEWKQQIKGSFLDEEEAYTQALKRAIQKEELIKVASFIEKLGDIYAAKRTSETFLQAAGLYNYALQLFSEDRQEIIKKKLFKVQSLLTELCNGKPISLEQMRKQFEANRQVLKKLREEIEKKIQALGSNPSSEEVRDLYKEITQGMKDFFKILVEQSIDTLGAAPCEYAMIGFGSLAREEMTPYSDLEFGILIQGDSEDNREYFKRLTNLIHLRVINLGETILPALNIPCIIKAGFFDSVTPRGFAFDGEGAKGKGCKTPFGNRQTFKLIQAPEKMAQYIAQDEYGKWWHDKEPHLPMELLNFTHLLGNSELTAQYKQKIQEKLNTPYQQCRNLRQYLAKVHLVKEDMASFDPGMGHLEKQGMLFKVKNDLYRFPHLAMDRLALLKKIVASDTFGRIEQLYKQGIITDSAAEKLKDWMSTALFMRLKTYSHYEAQKEMMNPLIIPFGFDDPDLIKKQFALESQALEDLKKIYRIFIPFYQAIDEYLDGRKERLKSSTLDDNSSQTQGNIALRFFQHKEALEWYNKAVQEDSENPQILNALGALYHEQGNLEKAAAYISQAIEINHDCLNKNCLNLMDYYCQNANLVRSYYSLASINKNKGNLKKAEENARQGIKISRELLGKNHWSLADGYNILGAIYQQKGNLDKAVKYAKKVLTIELECFGENHPRLARDYTNLGMAYQEQGNLEEATHLIKKALEIDIKLYGENHSQVAIEYENLGMICHEQKDFETAIKLVKKALEINFKLYGEIHPSVAMNYNNLGKIYQEQGILGQAAEHYMKALVLHRRLHGEDHCNVAVGYNNLATLYKEQGHLNQAVDYAKQALEIDKKISGENHPNVERDYYHLGLYFELQKNLVQAAEYIGNGLEVHYNLHGEFQHSARTNYNQLVKIYEKLIKIYKDKESLEMAATYAEKDLKIKLRFYGEKHREIAVSYTNLAQILQDQGLLEQAAKYTKKACEINEKVLGESYDATAATCYGNLGTIYRELGKLKLAAEYAKKALEIDLTIFGETHEAVAIDYNNLGTIYQQQGNFQLAAECAEKVLRIDLEIDGENHPNVISNYNNLCAIYHKQGNLKLAAEYAKKALRSSIVTYGIHHPTTIEINNVLKALKLLVRDVV